jgi:hypothetical protein
MDWATPVGTYWASRPVDMMDKAKALPTSPRGPTTAKDFQYEYGFGSMINNRNTP